MKLASYTLFFVCSALLGVATVQETGDAQQLEAVEHAAWEQAFAPEPLTVHKTYVRQFKLQANGTRDVQVPQHDPDDGDLDHVTVRGYVEFRTPSWYTGPYAQGAAFRCEDVQDNDQDAWVTWGFSNCPPDASENEGDPGGPWQKITWELDGTDYVAPRIETGLVRVEDPYDAFGGQTVEVHGRTAEDDDIWVTYSGLDEWEGTGEDTWTVTGTYGGNNTCSSLDASFIGGWETWVRLDVTYSYYP